MALVGVRVALPALIALVGLVVLIIGKADAANGIGMALIGVALLVLVANLLAHASQPHAHGFAPASSQ